MSQAISSLNEADGGVDNYDLYELNGNLAQSDFIDASAHTTRTTGIAYDGTDFFTSNIFAGTPNEWDSSGAFIKTITLSGNGSNGFLIEDLSVDYSQVLPPPTVPELNTLVLVGTSLLGLAGAARRNLAATRPDPRKFVTILREAGFLPEGGSRPFSCKSEDRRFSLTLVR